MPLATKIKVCFLDIFQYSSFKFIKAILKKKGVNYILIVEGVSLLLLIQVIPKDMNMKFEMKGNVIRHYLEVEGEGKGRPYELVPPKKTDHDG